MLGGIWPQLGTVKGTGCVRPGNDDHCSVHTFVTVSYCPPTKQVGNNASPEAVLSLFVVLEAVVAGQVGGCVGELVSRTQGQKGKIEYGEMPTGVRWEAAVCGWCGCVATGCVIFVVPKAWLAGPMARGIIV